MREPRLDLLRGKLRCWRRCGSTAIYRAVTGLLREPWKVSKCASTEMVWDLQLRTNLLGHHILILLRPSCTMERLNQGTNPSVRQKPTSGIAKDSHLVALPVELLELIIERLCLADFQAFRLTCKTVSSAARPLLATSDFCGRPWRNETARLRSLSQLGECARRIRTVALYYGEINEYKALHDSFSHHYVLEPRLRGNVMQEKWAEYFRTKKLRQASEPPDLTTVEDTLRKLPALRAAMLTWTRCPWETGSEPDRIFSADVSLRLAKKRVPETQKVFVEALAARGPDSLDELTLEPLAFTVPQGHMLRTLPRFRATLDCRSVPDVLERLSAVLADATALTELYLKYMNFTAVARPDASFLHGIHLGRLRVLELIRPSVHLDSLALFLIAHSETLRKVKIVAGRATTLIHDDDSDSEEMVADQDSGSVTTWKSLFVLIHDRLHLEEAHIAEVFVDAVDGKRIQFVHDAALTDCMGSGPDSQWVAPASEFENYLVRKGSWPSLIWP